MKVGTIRGTHYKGSLTDTNRRDICCIHGAQSFRPKLEKFPFLFKVTQIQGLMGFSQSAQTPVGQRVAFPPVMQIPAETGCWLRNGSEGEELLRAE